nr:PilZ domain-containing protein [Desulfobulbaceae bacterium]
MIKRYPRSKKQGVLSFFSTFFDKNSKTDIVVRRPPRVHLGHLHSVSFDMESPERQSGIGLTNISRTGIGFLASHCQWPQPGSSVQGTLNILNHKLPTTLRVVHLTSVVVGCHFTVIGQEFSEILSSYFDAELDALRLVKVSPQYLKKCPAGTPVWYKGLDNSELFIVHTDNRIHEFTMVFLGNTIHWSEHLESAQYGVYQGSEVELYSQTATSLPSSIVQPSEINITAIKFIQNIKDLKRGFTDQIEKILNISSSANLG